MSCCGGGSGVTGLCGVCGCTPCTCVYQNIIQTGGGGGGTPTAGQCVNLSGVCVLDAYNANTMYFRGIDTTDAAVLSIALNATNHTVELTINVNALAAALPQATTTQAGVGETATDAEAQAKASTTVFVTPSNFAAMDASTTFAGLVELATDAEAIAGVSTSLALTPANLAAAIAANYGTTRVFADAVARAAAVPDFAGQFAYQADIAGPLIGYATIAGGWIPLVSGQNYTYLAAATFTTLSLGANAGITVTGDPTCNFSVNSMQFQINTGILDLTSSGIGIGGTVTNNVLIGNGGFGFATSYDIANFIATYNTQSGYTTFSNPATIRTCDTATVTLQQLAQLVGTLIEDMKAVKLPSP